jgi:hypothetical protein
LDSEDGKTEDRETLKNEDTKAVVYDADIDRHKSAGFLEIVKTTRRDDHLNEEEIKKVCHCIMRIEHCLSSNNKQMHLFQSGPFDARLSLQKKAC